MKLAIAVCERINGICTTMGCFKAFNNKDKAFSIYKDVDVELNSFFTCDSCSKGSYENIENIAKKLKEVHIERVHFGVCVVKCEADNSIKLKDIFNKEGIEVIYGTH